MLFSACGKGTSVHSFFSQLTNYSTDNSFLSSVTYHN